MFSKIESCGINGAEGYSVAVEADVSNGLPGFIMVGYLAQEVRESEERVRTALKNSGFMLPPKKVTINLSPADIRKEGTSFDLAIAVAVLCCLEILEQEQTTKSVFIGELGLAGDVKPVKGVLPRVYTAMEQGADRCFLPMENVKEGTAVDGIEIVGVKNIKELAEMLKNPDLIVGKRFDGSLFRKENQNHYEIDYSEIAGQESVKRASQVASAGMHNILYIGPAGTGKTMAARRLPTIMPPLSLSESIRISKIYSICGLLSGEKPLITERPFRSPHHSVTAQTLVGGGRTPKPGEISLASCGVLFLDELTEFPARILDLLRQPMEDGTITVARLSGSVLFPAETMIAAAMNPCKCGHYPDKGRCTCTENQVQHYLNRISGPFLDRIDIGAEVPSLSFFDLKEKRKKKQSEDMRHQVETARQIQMERFSGSKTVFNSRMDQEELQEYCSILKKDEEFLQQVYQKFGFSARAHKKVLRTARTIADLEEKKQIDRVHLSEAISYRSFEKKYWGVRV